MAILGASSVSKSYGSVGWLYLDYQRDPDYTAIKLVTISSSKLEGLLFSPLKSLHEASVMQCVGEDHSNFRFTHNKDNINVGFEGILVPQDQKGTGKVKGIKYFRRKKRHPVFGISGRTRIFIDEFQDTSSGIIKDLSSPASQISGPHGMKIALSGNPTDYALSEAFGQVAEPPKGWADIDMETDHVWKSKKGYDVLRLDGACCENVIHKKNLCVGMISHEAYDAFCLDLSSPEYFTFARGMFPLQGGVSTLFSIPMLETAVGDALFHEGATRLGFVDVALRGDRAVFGVARIGMATGRITPEGERLMYTTGTQDDSRQPQLVLQIERLDELEGFDGDTTKLANIIRKRALADDIMPMHLGIDTTGMGEGVTSHLATYFGAVLAVHNGESSTSKKILQEDKSLPSDLYARIADELWFAAHKWFSVGAVLVSKDLDNRHILFNELSTRQIDRPAQSGKKRIEANDLWRKRNNNKSPDLADVVNGLIHVARMRTNMIPAMEKGGETLYRREPFRPPNADRVEGLHHKSLTSQKQGSTFDISKLQKRHAVGRL